MFELIFLILCSMWAVLIRKDFMRAVPNPLKSVIKKISALRAGACYAYAAHCRRSVCQPDQCKSASGAPVSTPPMQCKESFMFSLQAFMPHWTPTAQDNVVYATIKEAMSGSETDIETYLHSLKEELHIGQEGYPAHVTLAGDQQHMQ